VVVLPDPFRGIEVKEFRGNPTVGPRLKVWTKDQKWKKQSYRRLIVVVHSPPLYREVGRNGEANFPKGPTIQSPRNRLEQMNSSACCHTLLLIIEEVVNSHFGILESFDITPQANRS